MSKELFRALLNKQFYLEHKDYIIEDMFPNQLKKLIHILHNCYEKQDITTIDNVSVTELTNLYNVYHPTDSATFKELIYTFLNGLNHTEPLQPAIASMYLKQALIKYKQDELANLSTKVDNLPLDKVRSILTDLERLNNDTQENDSNTVDMDIDSLLNRTSRNSKWKFNIPLLSDFAGGIGPSILALLAGRVNSGKSLLAISLSYAPLGFAEQGAKILHLCNEEDAAFTGIRAMSSYTGMTLTEIRADKEHAAKLFKPIKDNIMLLDHAHMSMHTLSKLIDKHKPDIVIADMLDHVSVQGDYAREDSRLGQVYRQAREIAKDYSCAFIGVSQTSAESDGKMHYGFDALADSKTAKPAACDLILLLGAQAPDDQGNYSDARAINVAKNKITGKHGPVHCIIQPQLSRMVA